MIICANCKTQNPPERKECLNCGVDLLPGENFKDRIGTFIIGLVVGVFGGFASYFLFTHPEFAESKEFCMLTNPVIWLMITFVSPISATVTALRKTPDFLKYKNRAARHEAEFPDQAIDDYSKAIDLAPAKEKAPLIKVRSDLYKKMGKEEEALKDQLAYISTEGAYESSASFARLLGADKDTFIDQAIQDDRKKLIGEGKIKGVGFCLAGSHTVELNDQLKCPLHPKGKIFNHTFVMPEELEKTLLSVETASAGVVTQTKKRRIILWIVLGLVLLFCILIPGIAAVFSFLSGS